MARAVCQGAKTAKRYAALGAGMEVDAQGYGREPTAMVRGVLSCLFVCLFVPNPHFTTHSLHSSTTHTHHYHLASTTYALQHSLFSYFVLYPNLAFLKITSFASPLFVHYSISSTNYHLSIHSQQSRTTPHSILLHNNHRTRDTSTCHHAPPHIAPKLALHRHPIHFHTIFKMAFHSFHHILN